jgi:hypothetical protein
MEEPAPPTTPISPPDQTTRVADAPRRSTSVVEWVGVAAGGLALVASVLRWYTVTGPFADQVARSGLPTGRTAWGDGVTAWLPMVLLALAAAIVLAPRFGLSLPLRPVLWLVFALAALVLVIIRWVTIVPGDLPKGAVAGPGFGLYFGLVLAVVSLVGALLGFRTWRR